MSEHHDELLSLIRNTIRKCIADNIPSFQFTEVRLINGIQRLPETQKFVVSIEVPTKIGKEALSATETNLQQVADSLILSYNNISKLTRKQHIL